MATKDTARDTGKPWDFEKLMAELRKSLKFAYSTRRKNKGKEIPWDRPELTSFRLLAGSLNVKENFTVGNLAYHEDEQGRDALDVILMVAIQLGIEQGFRMLGDVSVGDKETRDKVRAEEDAIREKHNELREALKEYPELRGLYAELYALQLDQERKKY